MTLFELLIVLTILSLLAAIVAPRVVGYLGKAKTDVAKSQLSAISTSLELFYLDAGRYPTNEEGLDALVAAPETVDIWQGPYLKDEKGLIDPWGQSYLYSLDSDQSSFTIRTLGKDQKEGGENENMDVTIK